MNTVLTLSAMDLKTNVVFRTISYITQTFSVTHVFSGDLKILVKITKLEII